MFKINKLYQNKIFMRLLLIFLAILLVTYAIGLSAILLLSQRSKNEKVSFVQYTIDEMLNNLENDLASLGGLINDHVLYEEIMNLAINYNYMTPYERSVKIKVIQRILSFIKSRSPYIEDINCHIYNADRVIGQIGQIDVIDTRKIDLLREMQVDSKKPLLHIGDELHIFVQYPSASYKSSNVLFSIDTQLNTFNIVDKLNLVVGDKGQYALNFGGLGLNYILSSDQMDIKLFDNLPNLISEDDAFHEVKHQNSTYYLFTAASIQGTLNLLVMIPADDFTYDFQSLSLLIGAISLVFIFLLLFYSIWLQRYISHPIKQLIGGFKDLEESHFGVRLSGTTNNEFKEIFNYFNHISSMLNELIRKNIEQATLTKSAQLKYLQAQVNPHFLYNSFNLLSSMLHQEDLESACEYSKLLGNHFKYITRSDDNDIILSEEVSHARTYAEIQAKRFDGRIKLEFQSLPSEYTDILVPRLVLQPLIENAFEHGLQAKQNNGIVRVMFMQSQSYLLMKVEDNGKGLTSEQIDEIFNAASEMNKNVTGVINITRRLSIKYGDRNALQVLKSDLGGLCVTVRIPI